MHSSQAARGTLLQMRPQVRTPSGDGMSESVLNIEHLRAAAKFLREATRPKDGQFICMDNLEDGHWYRYTGTWPGPFERTLLIVDYSEWATGKAN